MQPSGRFDNWAGMTSRSTRAKEIRETAAAFRRLVQFVSGERAAVLIEGATALDRKAARLERRSASLQRLKRLAGRR